MNFDRYRPLNTLASLSCCLQLRGRCDTSSHSGAFQHHHRSDHCGHLVRLQSPAMQDSFLRWGEGTHVSNPLPSATVVAQDQCR